MIERRSHDITRMLVEEAQESFYEEHHVSNPAHNGKEVTHRRLNTVERAQKALDMLNALYYDPAIKRYLTRKTIKIADSRDPLLREISSGFIVYMDSEGVKVVSDNFYPPEDAAFARAYGIATDRFLTPTYLAQRYGVNSNDRIVDQMSRITPSHLAIRMGRLRK